MSEEDNKLLLNQYFATDDLTPKTEESDVVDDASIKMGSLKLDDNVSETKSEPEVCRIFAETPPQPKDPTAAFFDLIGTNSGASGGIISDLGISTDVRSMGM